MDSSIITYTMKRPVFLVLLLISGAAGAQQNAAGKRLNVLEKRVTKVEKRVTLLETGGSAAPEAAEKQPASPILVHFIRKKQVVTKEKMGIRIYLEFENASSRRYYAFNGTLVFKDASGAVIWTKPYGYSEPLGPGERTPVTFWVSSEQAKEYLKLVKTAELKVALEKQEFYGGI